MGDIDNALRRRFTEAAQTELVQLDLPAVPELDGLIWFKPVKAMTGKEFAALREAAESLNGVEVVYKTLILRARNAEGLREFSMGELGRVMETISPHDANAIIVRMGELEKTISVEDMKKKSPPSPT